MHMLLHVHFILLFHVVAEVRASQRRAGCIEQTHVNKQHIHIYGVMYLSDYDFSAIALVVQTQETCLSMGTGSAFISKIIQQSGGVAMRFKSCA